MPKQQENLRRSSRLSAKNKTKPQAEKDHEVKETVKELGPKKKIPKDEILIESPVENTVETEAQRKAFGNYLVLSNILNKLRTCDLINIRLVNSSWKETVNTILLRRKHLKAIDIRFIKQLGKFLLNSQHCHDLSELQNILENSTNFPCDDFRIEGPLDHPDLQKFLSACGSQINRLTLNFTTRYTKTSYPYRFKEIQSYEDLEKVDRTALKIIPYFRKLLTEQAVNLNSLNLHEIRFDHRNRLENNFVPLFPSPVILPELKYIEIQTYSWKRDPTSFHHISKDEEDWTQELLSAAPNLQSFVTSSLKVEPMNSLIKLGKPQALTEATIDLESNIPEDDQTLSQFNVTKLKVIRRAPDEQGYRNRLLRVLNLNVNTLTSISMELCDVIFAFSTTNVFQHVKKLSLIGLHEKDNDNQGCTKISLQHVFPNLETIRLEGAKDDRQTEEDFPFLTSLPVNTVKTLEVVHICPFKWLEFVPLVFPKVVHLILENYWNFPKDGRLFWSFSALKFIDLGTLIGVDNLDSVFTGFSKETSKRLREKSERALAQLLESEPMDIETEAETQELREFPSIVDLKDLRELRVKVADTKSRTIYDTGRTIRPSRRGGRGGTKRWRPQLYGTRSSPPSLNTDLISPVTSMYAFGMMPSLQRVEITLTPNETKSLPSQISSLSRLEELQTALAPMAEHPLVHLYPMQVNN